MLSCQERQHVLRDTLRRLKGCGWDTPEVVIDDQSGETSIARINVAWRRMIKLAAAAGSDFVLMCEDDLVFGTWFTHNLRSWPLLRQLPTNGGFYGSLYNPNRPLLERHEELRYHVADTQFMWGAQALVLTPITARYIDKNWHTGTNNNSDQRMPELASRLSPIYFHAPSLVDHATEPTTWGGVGHRAMDFNESWRAP